MILVAFITWIALSLIIGLISTKVVDLRGDSPILCFGAAAGGGVVAGLIHAFTTEVGIQPWEMWTLIFVAIGAIVGVSIFHLIRSRSISKDRQTVRSSY